MQEVLPATPKSKIPHTFVLLFSLILLAVISTHLIPSGQFQRVEDEQTGKTLVVPGSYERTEQTPIGPFGALIAVEKGMVDAADIVFFVFIAYASFFVVLQSGALNAFIGCLLRLLKGKEILVIPVFMYTFALGGGIFGMYEETFGFIPLFVGLAIALGYDALVGMSMVCFAVAMGFAAAFMNPFTIGVAQSVAQITPLFSGLGFRFILWVLMVTMAVLWTMRYAYRIKKDPTKSYLYGLDMAELALDHDELLSSSLTGRNASILAVVGSTIALLVWGVISRGWYFEEIAALFLGMGILSGFLAGWGPSKLASVYVEGARDIIFGALVIGLSRGVVIVLQEGNVIDTIIYSLAQPLVILPRWLAAQGMLFVQTLINFLIPSGSGQAAATMPVMAPLADLLSIKRDVAVLAFQFGDGFSNILWPTDLLPVMCSIAKVPIEKWWKFFIPFFLILLVVQMAILSMTVVFNFL